MPPTAYKNYLLIVLMVVLAFNNLDRLAVGVLLQDIKVDLALSDTQLGVLTGIAFALFYSVMGIPIARWADRGNRVTIISLTAALWSAAVALCGAAGNFLQLLLARIFVAVGEAGCNPPALSLISDYFTRAERPRAIARYMLGFPLALVVGYFASGWLNEFYGWRATFAILGLPGLALAALVAFTIKEPRRTETRGANIGSGPEPSLKVVFVTLWANGTFRHLMFFFSVWCFFGFGIVQWQPAFFMRSHGLQTGELGTWLAGVYGLGGLVGTYLGGEWASRYARHNERLQLRVVAALMCLFTIFVAGAYLASSYHLAFVMLVVSAVGGAAINGPMFATIQTIVPSRMRATAIALLYFFANLIGMGLGPLAVGALSDGLGPRFGEDSLRYALLAFCPGYFWAGWHAWQAGRVVTGDIATLVDQDNGQEVQA